MKLKLTLAFLLVMSVCSLWNVQAQDQILVRGTVIYKSAFRLIEGLIRGQSPLKLGISGTDSLEHIDTYA